MEVGNIIILMLYTTRSISAIAGASRLCRGIQWCKECITAQGGCAWCSAVEFNYQRCDTGEELQRQQCTDIINPRNTQTVEKNETLKDRDETQKAVQVQPQKIKLVLRQGLTQSFKMKYRTSKNLPIDMYFVLDFSTTMNKRLTTLANLTQQLIDGLRANFTSNIHIGFGSFLDKPLQPFTITSTIQLENPCVSDNTTTTCEPSYGFIHQQKLNDNIKDFITFIKTANTSRNFDPMEGGLDAVLQAAVCPEIIGWRSDSRRVMVYISDSGFHFAGDAKLAGIDKPNDGKCHMEPRKGSIPNHFIYTHTDKQDYPSFGQLGQVLDQNKINVFFVVTEEDKEMYTGLSLMIKQAQTATMKQEDASKIVEDIKVYYTNISKKIEISAEKVPEHTKISIATDCATGNDSKFYDISKQSIVCNNLDIGKTVEFNVSITAIACPANLSAKHILKIVPAGLQEALEIEIEYICNCTDCNRSETMDNEICTGGNGTYECGACRCNEGRRGEQCECDNKNTNIFMNDENCKRFNNTDTICENHGNCRCDQCHCSTNFEGRFCECDMNKCTASGSSERCSGQGECICGVCSCKNGYSGSHCECQQTACIANNSSFVCSMHGDCKCGKCFCSAGYTGSHCENCPNCEKCHDCAYADCVKRYKNISYTLKEPKAASLPDCNGINVTLVNKFNTGTNSCVYFDLENCEINYLVTCNNDNKSVHLQIAKKKFCSSPPDPVLIALPVLGGILGVGLLLLIIWKILTSFYDNIEYAKFEHEIKNPVWSQEENPIYNSPVTSNQNPVYRKELDD